MQHGFPGSRYKDCKIAICQGNSLLRLNRCCCGETKRIKRAGPREWHELTRLPEIIFFTFINSVILGFLVVFLRKNRWLACSLNLIITTENSDDMVLHFYLFWAIFAQHNCVISHYHATHMLNEPSFIIRESMQYII